MTLNPSEQKELSPAGQHFLRWRGYIESSRQQPSIKSAYLAGFVDGIAHYVLEQEKQKDRDADNSADSSADNRPFVAGDCVQLKCGSPTMVVFEVEEGESISCLWYCPNKEACSEEDFHPAVLKHV